MSYNDRYSPSLTGNLEAWERLIDLGREHGSAEVLQRALRTFNNSKEQFDVKEDGLDYIISSESERVKTKEDLIAETAVNEEEYDIYRYITNKWDQHSVDKGLVELYQVKLWMKRLYLKRPDPQWLEDWLNSFDKELKPEKATLDTPATGKPLVLALADLHTGGFSEGEVLIPDYNVEEVRKRLDYITKVMNSYDRPIHVKILGDLIESFTGKNHSNTWKQIEIHGMEAALVAYDIIREFLMKLENFASIKIIGGNHDRISSHWADDKQGQVAYLVNGLLQRHFNNIDTEFSPILLNSVHDDISYILTHGDKRITKSDSSELVLKYGHQDLYNVLLHAHGHEEEVSKSTRKLRVHQIPPICTPNKYAVESGYDGASGFVLVESNPFGTVDIITKGL